EFRSLLVAPRELRSSLVDLIEHEASFGTDGYIIAKLNSLADPGMSEALYRASQAGVRIDLITRGICCLRPGVAGLSETIRVRSILGRYLEHSRIVRFEHGDNDAPLFLIGSADWMGRNLDGRVEVMVPVTHPKHRDWLDQVLTFDLADDIVRHELDADGRWHRRGPAQFDHGDAQDRFYRWVTDRQRL
ncbi:MAG: RNA degradosome polyphosphate kinase, partial [Actinomycetota bacterium]